ncbi:hypothetical protein [Streptomyces brasiliscabiei]|uniref:hypothetical protein n=1 Tax=Streptomyces brasiliscabiei TaxID=2736302 RepID=UPI001C11D6E2|nr:hypothetical protein [Streptomyces brasiliscabiei]
MAHGLTRDPELPDLAGREGGAHPFWDPDEVHDIYRAWPKLADGYPDDRSSVTEARAETSERLAAHVRQGQEAGRPEVEDLPESALQDPVWERSGHTERGRDAAGSRSPVGQDRPLRLQYLRVRHEHSALGAGTLTWLDEVPAGVLAFRRDPGFVCVVNLSTEPYQLPDHTRVLLSSGPVEDHRPAPDQAARLAVCAGHTPEVPRACPVSLPADRTGPGST